MALVVMKFGGTSVADLERIRHVAHHVQREHKAGNQVAVVVSAMAGQTNQLVAYVNEACSNPCQSEYDAVVASGEQVTSGLLALCLQNIGIPARSWQGWQIPLETDEAHGKARIRNIQAKQMLASMNKGEVSVVAGFQGIAPDGRIATLGRGGSDTSAVAIAAALGADICDIYTDVDGVYTTDPRIVPKARRLSKVSYEEMLEMASLGAKVLQTRSVELAMTNNVRLAVRSSFDDPASVPAIGGDLNSYVGTLVCSEDEIVEQQVVSGIAYAKDEAKVTLISIPDKPGIAAMVFGPLADANINVDMILQNVSADGATTDITFTVAETDLDRALEVLGNNKEELSYQDLVGARNIVKISIIGIGMRSHAGVASAMFKDLSDKGINIQAISTSEIKISILIDAAYQELAVRSLHTLFGLDQEQN